MNFVDWNIIPLIYDLLPDEDKTAMIWVNQFNVASSLDIQYTNETRLEKFCLS